MAVIGQLDLEIHGRTPDDVDGALCPGRLHDLVEQVRGQNLGILYRNTRVQLRELGDQVGRFGQIRRGLDHKADLRPALFCFLACARVLGKGLAAKGEVYRKPERYRRAVGGWAELGEAFAWAVRNLLTW